VVGHASIVLLTVAGLEAVVLASRLGSPRGRPEHIRLLVLVVVLALDELAPPGLTRHLAALAVAVAAGNVLVPRHRMTTVLNVAAGAAAALTVVTAVLGTLSAAQGVILLCALGVLSFVLFLLERHWMGTRVFVALLVTGTIWFVGRSLALGPGGIAFPLPGLPLALALGAAIPTWWFLPDGPLANRWDKYTSELDRLEHTDGRLLDDVRAAAFGFVAAGAAHEFRTTLAAVGSLGRWGRGRAAPEDKDVALDAITGRVDEALRTVVGLLTQLTARGRETPGPVRLGVDYSHLLSFVRATCRRDGITLSFEAVGDPVVSVRVGEVEHVLLNLLHNAARAFTTQAGGERRIDVRVATRDGAGIVEVEDTAGGVPDGRVPTLFTPSPSAEGAGIGLFLARGLTERNGGVIEYVRLAEGSLFRLRFPLHAATSVP
jgi:signal transduction histidine kinase